MTNGVVEVGDAERCLRVEVDKTTSALIGLLTYREIGDSYFCRLALSAGEADETSRPEPSGEIHRTRRFCTTLSASSDKLDYD